MEEKVLVRLVAGSALRLHHKFGRGESFSLYQQKMQDELTRLGVFSMLLDPVPVIYKNIILDRGKCANLLIEGKLLVGIITESTFLDYHAARIKKNLNNSMYAFGMLIQFNVSQFNRAAIRFLFDGKIFPDNTSKTNDYANFVDTLAEGNGKELDHTIARIRC